MITEKLDQLIEYVTRNNSSDYIYQAKQEYQKIAGEIYEDDKSYENRMGLFLEWFIFDRLTPEKNITLIESMTNGNNLLAVEDLIVFKDFSQSIHSLFLIKKIRQDRVTVQDLFSGEKYEVSEPQSQIIFQPKDIFEGRILPYEGEYYFSGNFGFHPKEVSKYILRVAKQIASEFHKCHKESDQIDALINKIKSQIEKLDKKIAKLRTKIENTDSPEKRLSFLDQKADLHNEKMAMNEQLSALKSQKSSHHEQKFKIEYGTLASQWLQKLNYMNLKWERSRQIDPQDIYCD
jgi:hypothetical protein